MPAQVLREQFRDLEHAKAVDEYLRELVANFAAHRYDDLDPRRVWRTVTRDVPHLRPNCGNSRLKLPILLPRYYVCGIAWEVL